VAVSGDPVLAALADELRELATAPGNNGEAPVPVDNGVLVPLQLQSEAGVLSFISTITVFGTPIDITLSELALETFFPADAHTQRALQALGQRLCDSSG
jgi:hypothetical protein